MHVSSFIAIKVHLSDDPNNALSLNSNNIKSKRPGRAGAGIARGV